MKKATKFVFSLLISAIIIISTFSTTVFADSSHVFEAIKTADVSEEEKEYSIEKRSFEKVECNDISDFEKNTIITFDVSANGKIAVGLDNATVLICDKDMNIEEALSFDMSPSGGYYLGWYGDNLCLLLSRGSYIYFISLEGEIVDVRIYNEWDSETNTILREITHRETTYVNDTEYGIEKTTFTMKYMGGDKHDTFYRKTQNGEKEILFNSQIKSPKEYIALDVIYIVGLFMFAVLILSSTFALIIVRRKLKKQNEGQGKTGNGNAS